MPVQHPMAKANKQSPFGSLSPDEFYVRYCVYIINSCSLKLFTQWWAPLSPTQPIGCVAIVQGYTSKTYWFVQLTSILFAQSGFIVFITDHQGRFFSNDLDGLIYHIPNINPVLGDCIHFFKKYCEAHMPNSPA